MIIFEVAEVYWDKMRSTGQYRIVGPILILFLLSCLLFFVRLGTPGLTDRDEATYSEATREMIETGDWITPKLNGANRFDKPILIYYIMAASFSLFGVNEFAARFPSAVFATLLLLLIFLFLRRHLSARIALLAALILGANLEIAALGRAAVTDMALILTTTGSLLFFFEGTRGRRHAYLAVYPLLALAFLIKGPVGVVVFLVAVIPYLILTGGIRSFFKEGYPLLGLITFMLIVLPWFVAVLLVHGANYAASARTFTLGRFFSTVGGHNGTILFYIPVLLIAFFPWVVWLPSSIRHAFRALKQADRPLGSADTLSLFAMLWMFGGLIFFSLSHTRMAHYIAPLYPAMAILVAQAWERLFEGERPRKGSIVFLVIMGAAFGIFFLAAPFLLERLRHLYTRQILLSEPLDVTMPFFVLGVVVLSGTAIACVALVRRLIPAALAASYAMILIFILATIFLVVPRLDDLLLAPSRELARIAGKSLGPDGVFIAYKTYRPSLIFYARHPVVRLGSGQEGEVERILESTSQAIILVWRSPDWKPPASWGRPLDSRGPYILLTYP